MHNIFEDIRLELQSEISKLKVILRNIKDDIYLLQKPLSLKSRDYGYSDGLIVLVKNCKILFIDINNNKESDEFLDFVDYVVEDIAKLSWMYGFEELIGRARKWKEFVVKKNIDEINEKVFEDIRLNNLRDKRLVNILISFFIGSINESERITSLEPKTVLELVNQRIILFDTNQLKFIFKEPEKKKIYIQGLSGTGKTELLFHKIRELYLSKKDVKILLTCHNKILANDLNKRLKEFFNVTKTPKQIDSEYIKIIHAWGSRNDINSGTYRYICNFYKIPFYNLGQKKFDLACEEAIKNIKEKGSFEYAFDYILIDESQDFPDSFFELCELVASKKVYIVGDVFQDIFEYSKKKITPDIVLNKCYRTDPKTLMIAHSIGMGLFEKPHLRWLEKSEWENIGYDYKENENLAILKRFPLKRFDDDIEKSLPDSFEIRESEDIVKETLNILEEIQIKFQDISPDNIAIVLIDNDKYIYKLADILVHEIYEKFKWKSIRGYESKERIDGHLFISNRNNIKGLEFSFIICITKSIIDDLTYRNVAYTMISRSFLKTFLVTKSKIKEEIIKGIETIKKENCIKTYIPSEEEKRKIEKLIIEYNKNKKSFEEFLENIFDELNIEKSKRVKLQKIVLEIVGKNFNKDKIVKCIKVNKELL